MAVFVDTSALYALAVSSDVNHVAAAATFRELRGEVLLTHNYIVLESVALLQARRGIEAVRRLLNDLLAVVSVDWIEPDVHAEAVAALLASGRRQVSLVDRVSFTFMRHRSIARAFAFDVHFREEGFDVVVDDRA